MRQPALLAECTGHPLDEEGVKNENVFELICRGKVYTSYERVFSFSPQVRNGSDYEAGR